MVFFLLGVRFWGLGIGSLRQFINSLMTQPFLLFAKKSTIFATVKNSYDRHCLASYEFRIVKSSFTMKIKKMIYLFWDKEKRQKT